MEIESSVNQINAGDPERFLLADGFFIEHPHVDENFGGIRAGFSLKANAEPAVAAFAASGDGIGEAEESSFRAAFIFKAFEEEVVFVIEHRAKATTTDVTFSGTVNSVADGHVVG